MILHLFEKQKSGQREICSDRLFWIKNDPAIWALQTIVAIISMAETVLLFYISYKVAVFMKLSKLTWNNWRPMTHGLADPCAPRGSGHKHV